MKGCTACYDLTVEFPAADARGARRRAPRPTPTPACARSSRRWSPTSPSTRRSPAFSTRCPPALQKEVERLRMAPYEASLTAMRRVLTDWSFDRELVRPAVAPTIPHHCSDEFMRGCASLAREFGVGLHTHVHGVQGAGDRRPQEIRQDADRASCRTSACSDRISSPPTACGSTTTTSQRLADHGASVAHNPGSNMRLGNGIAAVRTMLEQQLNVGIGTDGATCCDNQNMYEVDARRLLRLEGARGRTPAAGSPREEILEAATAGSARALGFGDRIGRIAKGYKADLVFLDLAHINWIPLQRPHQPARAHRGRQRRAFRHGRRPDGGRKPQARRPSISPRSPRRPRPRASASPPPTPATRPCSSACKASSTPSAPGLAKTPYHIDRFAGAHHAH